MRLSAASLHEQSNPQEKTHFARNSRGDPSPKCAIKRLYCCCHHPRVSAHHPFAYASDFGKSLLQIPFYINS